MLVALLEDDPLWAEAVGVAIKDAGWRLVWHATAEAMLADDRALHAGVLVSDVLLAEGGMDGRDFVKVVRERGVATPILMLTQFAADHRAAEAFRNRADDYLTKPFEGDELIERLRSLERRGTRVADDGTIKVGRLKVSPRFRVAYWEDTVGKDTLLTLSEQSFRLLECLADSAGQVVSRATLWRRCWPLQSRLDPQQAVIDTAMNNLRNDISAVGMPRDLIVTVRGRGYMLDIPGT